MPCSVVVGSQWGDEGKAKVIDFLCADARYIVRYQGGANAGHTVVNKGEKFVFHLLPSGILHEDKICAIGNGVVLDPEEFLNEVQQIEEYGIKVEGRLYISNHAHVIMPYHKLFDLYREKKLKKNKIGTTGRGIGPCYADKITRTGIRVADLFDKSLRDILEPIIEEKNFLLKNYYEEDILDLDEVYETYKAYGEKLLPFAKNISYLLNKALDDNEHIVCEGAQGTILDIDFGTYPYVTSSNATSGGATIGTGIPPHKIDKVYGVMKPYVTRVGEGAFPTELNDESGSILQTKGDEFGATTGRARRCGWFDVVLGRYAVMINGINEIFLTKLDVLDSLETIKVCTGYDLDGKVIDEVPAARNELQRMKPVYKEFPGWKTDISGMRNYDELPDNAKKFIEVIQELLKTRISYISVGPDREETIKVP